MAKKDKKNEITLECAECKARNYITSKSSGLRAKKLELKLKKYCPVCRQHTLHRETK